jgi:tetratricopeptide (TPR) repeat protein
VLFASLALPARASAATPKVLAKVEFDTAQIQYKVGHFDEALEGYSRAYELFPAPAFLFNIGQCHKNLKNYERAIFFFEGYLRDEKNPARRTLADELLAESRAALQKQTTPTPPSTEPLQESAPHAGGAVAAVRAVPSLAPPPGGSTAASPVLVSSTAETSADAIHTPALTHRWWFWAAIGAGVLVAAGSAVYLSSGATTAVPPSGTIGTLDRR